MHSGIRPIIVGLILLLLGAFALPYAFILSFDVEGQRGARFAVPGETTLDIEGEGRYYLWNHFQVEFEGRIFDQTRSLPEGVGIAIMDGSGQPLDFTPDPSLLASRQGDARSSVGYVDLTDSGPIKITVSDLDEDRIFSLSRSSLVGTFLIIMAVGLGSMLVALIGFIVMIWGIVQWVQSGKSNVR